MTIRTLKIENDQAPRDLALIKDLSPYFFACGTDVTKWTALELYQLEGIITNDSAVQLCWRNKVTRWRRTQQDDRADYSLEAVLNCVPPKRLLLEAIRELSPEAKAQIRRAVLEKKAALAS